MTDVLIRRGRASKGAVQRKDHVRTQQEDGHLQAKDRPLEKPNLLTT